MTPFATMCSRCRRPESESIVAGYTAGSLDRLSHVLRDHGLDRQQVHSSPGPTRSSSSRTSWAWWRCRWTPASRPADAAIIAEPEILGDRLSRPARQRKRSDQFLAELATFAEGDYVVHVDHGIGRYDGLETLDVGGAPHDCLRLIYDGGDKLYIPVENIDVISRYSSEDALVQLDKLGGLAWQSRKSRVKQRIREIAQQLIKTAAERQVRSGQTMQPPEGLYEEFCARFPYIETEDQAARDRRRDRRSGVRPADGPADLRRCRLRQDRGGAARRLHRRHGRLPGRHRHADDAALPPALTDTFSERFAGLPVRVAQLSRLVAGKAATADQGRI